MEVAAQFAAVESFLLMARQVAATAKLEPLLLLDPTHAPLVTPERTLVLDLALASFAHRECTHLCERSRAAVAKAERFREVVHPPVTSVLLVSTPTLRRVTSASLVLLVL